MTEGISDLIIAISIAVVTLIVKLRFKKLKWGWQLLMILGLTIVISVISHLVVKACLE